MLDYQIQPGKVVRRPAEYMAEKAANAFAGLPAGFSHHKQLIEPIRQVRPLTGLSDGAVNTLACLLDLSRTADWHHGAKPLIYPGNDRLGLSAGSISSARRHLRELREVGAIRIEYGPGNRRAPMKDSHGNIVAMYGIDLSPLVPFALRMAELAKHQIERRHALRAIRSEIIARCDRAAAHLSCVASIEGSTNLQIKETIKQRLVQIADDAEAIASEVRTIFRRDPRDGLDEQSANTSRLTELDSMIRGLDAEGIALVDDLLGTGLHMQSLQHEESKKMNSPLFENEHQNTTKESSSQKVVNSMARRGEVVTSVTAKIPADPHGDGILELDFDPSIQLENAKKPEIRWTADTLSALSPSFADLMRRFRLKEPSQATLDDLAVVGRTAALKIGLSNSAWIKAVERHGVVRTALCALVANDKPECEIRFSRASFLAGMLAKPSNEPNPLASLFAIAGRRRSQELLSRK